MRFKRTTPFNKQCGFTVYHEWGEVDRCEADADFGLYFGDELRVSMISLCTYHTINQESLWISQSGGEE